MELDPSEYRDSMHRILTSVVTPRPIGWISTRTEERDNLAPYSYFNAVSTYPPVVMFSGGFRDGEPKDSGRMAVETGEFVANLVTEDLAAAMDETSAPLGDASEFDFAGVEREEAVAVEAPRVAAAAACLECTVHDTLEVHDNLVVFGAVEHVHVDERIATDGVVDMREIDSVGRLGGPYYTGIDVLDVERTDFGPWDGPVPEGFTVEETGRLAADPEAFRAVGDAVRAIDDGAPIERVAAETGFDPETLAACHERRTLYLEAETDDERIEAALAEAGIEAGFTY